MQYLSGKDIRRKFIDFWVSKGAHHFPSFSLVPDDPSLLFTIAGMVPFKKYYLGLEEPPVKSAVTSQKCVRTNDIENVGHTARHHTFFEMLGNFSWGGYFKHESLTWGWEFLTQVIGLDGSRMYATIYKDDEEAYKVWHDEIGLADDHILRCGEEENFWFMGPQGPCGPDSEILYDQGEKFSCGPNCHPGCDCDRYLEIWNHVFTQFDRQEDGSMLPLPRKNIDTGMGLERLTSLVQGVTNDFETDLFLPLIRKVTDLSGVAYGSSAAGDLALKVISDHIRSVCFMLADGILPSNEGPGYVLRRLLRRAVRYGRLIGIDRPFLNDLLPVVVSEMSDPYAELAESQLTIRQIIDVEENRFGRTLSQGCALLNDEIDRAVKTGSKTLAGDVAFQLYDTYGFPLELTTEICSEKNLTVDESEFKAQMTQQKDRARKASKQVGVVITGDAFTALQNRLGTVPFVGYDALSSSSQIVGLVCDGALVDRLETGQSGQAVVTPTPFYAERGGQVGDTGTLTAVRTEAAVTGCFYRAGDLSVLDITVNSGALETDQFVTASVDKERRAAITRNHTATHLLHQALIDVLGGHVRQNGSLVSPEFLRFDYTHFEAMTPEQIRQVETLANRKVLANMPVDTEQMNLADAKAKGAKALFEEKYGDVVRVVSAGDFSCELCGGTHVRATGEIGLVKIVSEESIGSGVRRLTAVTGMNSYDMFDKASSALRTLAQKFNVRPEGVVEQVAALEQENKELARQLADKVKSDLAGRLDGGIARTELDGCCLCSARIDGVPMDMMREAGDRVKDKEPRSVVVFMGQTEEGKVQILCMVGAEALKAGYHAGKIVKALAGLVGGGGGGRPDMAQAGGRDCAKIDQALAAAEGIVSSSRGGTKK